MKTKNKMIALLEIAIVLCSLFLVAIPAIAAEQNQEMQKGSANTITTASEDDYVLGVYGNANEDDTIDMRDLTYVKLIFFGKKPETELADAKYDGKINPLDFIQIKLIIVGKEKELTVVDSVDRIVTVKKPVKRVVSFRPYHAEAIRMFRAQDIIVGIGSSIKKDEIYFPELSKLPSVGTDHNPDFEVVVSINPDLVISGTYNVKKISEKLPESIPVVGLELYKSETLIEELVKLGYIFNKKDEAKHYIVDFRDKYFDFIKVQTEKLSEEERPKVYVEREKGAYQTFGSESAAHRFIDMAGGRYIFAELPGCYMVVDAEEVVVRNPDIIIKYSKSPNSGYGVDDTSKMEVLRASIMNRPELANVNAVKNGAVYIMDKDSIYGLDYPIAIICWAKWFHPDLFEDLDPQQIHQEFLTEFHRLDYDLDEHGVFVYHPEEHPDGK